MMLILVSTKLQDFKDGAYLGLAIGLVILVYVLVRKYAKRT